MSYQFIRAFVLFAATVFSTTSLDAQYGNLTKRIPDNANTILLLDVASVQRSPIAVKQRWRDDHESQFSAGLILVPPTATKFVMASELDFDALQPICTVALMDLNYEPSVPKVAARLNGTTDNINGLEIAVLPGDFYAVKFGPRLVGIGAPANRQDVGRWINQIHSNSLRGPSEYLAEAQEFAESGAPIMMAMDLEHVVSASHVRAHLEEMDVLKDSDIDPDKLSEVIASIRGVSLGITLGEQRYGKIKIDFKEQVPLTPEQAKAILLEVLAHRGAMIDEFEMWTPQVNGKQVSIEGNLYASGMRRILSILDTPPSLQPHQAPGEEGDSEEKLMALASQQYFKSVTSLLDDLRGKRQSSNFTTWGQIGMWFQKYSAKIDQLPMLNVDPELLDWGSWISSQLRDSERAMKGIGARSRVAEQQVQPQYTTRTYSTPIGVTSNRWGGSRAYGWHGWTSQYDAQRTQQLKSQARTQEKIRGNAQANMSMQGVEQATGDMRRYLTQKYQEFQLEF